MKAVKGYTKDHYRKIENAPVVKEFATISEAAEYLAQKHRSSTEYMVNSIMNDTNCDAIYFPDDSVILYEF